MARATATWVRNMLAPWVRNILARNMLARFCPIHPVARTAIGGLGGHHSDGLVHEHSCSCSRTPGASKHSWHLKSVTPHCGTEARQVWDHWRPEIADAKSPFVLGCHCRTLATLTVRPFSKQLKGPTTCTNIVSSVLLATPTSLPSGCKPGSALTTLASRHLRTDRVQAWTIAARIQHE